MCSATIATVIVTVAMIVMVSCLLIAFIAASQMQLSGLPPAPNRRMWQDVARKAPVNEKILSPRVTVMLKLSPVQFFQPCLEEL